jgi:hypothetical protein
MAGRQNTSKRIERIRRIRSKNKIQTISQDLVDRISINTNQCGLGMSPTDVGKKVGWGKFLSLKHRKE